MSRRGAIGLAMLSVGAICVSARADDKKKPGLFDFETWKTPAAHQRDAAKTLAPGQFDLEPLGRFEDAPRAIHLRVYADRDYRAGVLHWREKLRAQLEGVNHVVEPVFNVRFEIESLREWDRSHVGVALDPILAELEALDGARDVDWVLGLVTPFHGVATSAHQVGIARLVARSFVLRAMDDAEEGRALERDLALLPAGERDKLYGDRKAHKETVLFLHEWAHTMGALHVEDETMIMNPLYDPRRAAFSDFEKRLVELVVARRLGDRKQAYPESAALLRLVEKTPLTEGTERERASLAELLRQRAAGGAVAAPRAGPDAGVAAASAVNAAARETIGRALLRLRADDLAGATPLVFEAASLAATGPPDPAALVQIAEAAGAIGALTTADAALGRVRQDARPPRLVAELAATRARVALPPDAKKLGVEPADEPRYVATFWSASNAVASRSFPAAERRLAELAEAFPESAGRAAVACNLAVATKRFAAAEPLCASALAKDPGAVPAHLASGRLAVHARRAGEAEKHFRRAMLLDLEDETAWRELGRLYRAQGSSIEYEQLGREHQALLAKPLPP